MSRRRGVVAEDTAELLREIMTTGVTFAKARQMAVSQLYGDEIGDILAQPNDTLGVEYVRALTEIDSTIMPFAIPRTGVVHDAIRPSGGIASASYIRSLMRQGDMGAAETYIPPEMAKIFHRAKAEGLGPYDEAVLELAMLSTLRRMSPQTSPLPDISGAQKPAFTAIRRSTSLEGFTIKLKPSGYGRPYPPHPMAGYLGLTAYGQAGAPYTGARL